MLHSADHYRKRMPILPEIDKEIKRNIAEISEIIDDAVRINKTKIIYELQSYFNNLVCPFLPHEYIQKKIYSSIISELKSKNFQVKFETKNNANFLHINWNIKINKEDIDSMNNIIFS